MQWYNIIRKVRRTVLSIALPPALPLWSWHCYGVVPPGHDQHTDNLLDSINDEIAAHFLLVIKSGRLVILSPVPMNSSSSQRSRAHLTSASSWCSTSALGVKPHRLQSLDFTMMGSWPKDCLMMPLGTPLIDQLTSAWGDRKMKAFPRTCTRFFKTPLKLTTSFPLYEHLLPLHSAGYTFMSLQMLPLATMGLYMVASTKPMLSLSFFTVNSRGRIDCGRRNSVKSIFNTPDRGGNEGSFSKPAC